MVKKALILISGGIDSTTLLHFIIKKLNFKDVIALSFNYGQKHLKELEEAKWQCQQLKEYVKNHFIIDLSFSKEILSNKSALIGNKLAVPKLKDIAKNNLNQPITYVPNRNMTLLSLAVSYAESLGCSYIFYGAQQQDEYGYWDCTTKFLKRMNKVLSLNRKNKCKILAPFIKKNKVYEISLGLKMGVDYNHTWTCYKGQEEICHHCPSCVERASAFATLKIKDPLLN